jgi:hypothetical protein
MSLSGCNLLISWLSKTHLKLALVIGVGVLTIPCCHLEVFRHFLRVVKLFDSLMRILHLPTQVIYFQYQCGSVLSTNRDSSHSSLMLENSSTSYMNE